MTKIYDLKIIRIMCSGNYLVKWFQIKIFLHWIAVVFEFQVYSKEYREFKGHFKYSRM